MMSGMIKQNGLIIGAERVNPTKICSDRRIVQQNLFLIAEDVFPLIDILRVYIS